MSNKALLDASSHGHLEVVERLLAAGADVHASDDAALYGASSFGHLAVVERLLDAGADVHCCQDGAVREASEAGHYTVVGRLLCAGADPSAVLWANAETAWPMLVQCIPRAKFLALPEDLRPLWLRYNLRVRMRLAQHLQRARDRLDRPPASTLGTADITREALIAHLFSAGRRFAREYWTDGLPIFFPTLDLGPVPEEFVFHTW